MPRYNFCVDVWLKESLVYKQSFFHKNRCVKKLLQHDLEHYKVKGATCSSTTPETHISLHFIL